MPKSRGGMLELMRRESQRQRARRGRPRGPGGREFATTERGTTWTGTRRPDGDEDGVRPGGDRAKMLRAPGPEDG